MTDDKDDNLPALGSSKRDRSVSVIKGALGAIPFAGTIFSEIAGNLIPDQRLDRLENYVKLLSKKLEELSNELDIEKIKDAKSIDLFEDGAIQSARALSTERLDYISSLVAVGISGSEKERIESKRLLRLLGELDDDQIIITSSYLRKNQNSEFRDSHSDLLDPITAHLQSSQEELDQSNIYELTRSQLQQLNLLRHRFRRPKKGEFPEFDDKTGMMKASGREITPLGRLLLRQIGLCGPEDF